MRTGGEAFIPKPRGTFDADEEIQTDPYRKKLIFLKFVRISMKASAVITAIFESIFTESKII